MTRLSLETINDAHPSVERPEYDITATEIGLIHIGPGAFHRAHQAVYTDDAMAISGGDWGICAISLNSTTLADALSPQDGLYTTAIRDSESSYRIIGALSEVIAARRDPDTAMARLTDPNISIVTLTITEKGYALNAEGKLDTDNASIKTDLAHPNKPQSAIGYLVAATRTRRETGAPPLTPISCDNLPHNGDRLRQACADFARHSDAALAQFIESQMSFPNTMVDSITPAADDDLIHAVETAIGLHDAAPVQRETYTQWVIQDRLPEHRPNWAGAGAILTDDVAGYEAAKLRVLNGAHSTLTYLGLLAGLDSVEQAISHPDIGPFVDQLIRTESIPSVHAPAELDLPNYWDAIRVRFSNPEIVHCLEQISHDGSQKIPARILPVIEHHAGHAPLACFVAGAWIAFIQARRASDIPPVDPALLAMDLPDPDISSRDFALAMLVLPALFPASIRENTAASQAIVDAAVTVSKRGVLDAIQEFVR